MDYVYISTVARTEFTAFQSLICTCRQIHHELLPLLVKDQTIRVPLRHIGAFLDSTLGLYVFHPDISSTIPVHIQISMDVLPSSCFVMETDIAPLLRLVLNRRNFRLSFITTEPRSVQNVEFLNRIFSMEFRDAWIAACKSWLVQFELNEADLDSGIYRGNVDLFVRKGHTAPDLTTLGFDDRWADPQPNSVEGNRGWLFVNVINNYCGLYGH
jgi:hypothetical protein